MLTGSPLVQNRWPIPREGSALFDEDIVFFDEQERALAGGAKNFRGTERERALAAFKIMDSGKNDFSPTLFLFWWVFSGLVKHVGSRVATDCVISHRSADGPVSFVSQKKSCSIGSPEKSLH